MCQCVFNYCGKAGIMCLITCGCIMKSASCACNTIICMRFPKFRYVTTCKLARGLAQPQYLATEHVQKMSLSLHVVLKQRPLLSTFQRALAQLSLQPYKTQQRQTLSTTSRMAAKDPCCEQLQKFKDEKKVSCVGANQNGYMAKRGHCMLAC